MTLKMSNRTSGTAAASSVLGRLARSRVVQLAAFGIVVLFTVYCMGVGQSDVTVRIVGENTVDHHVANTNVTLGGFKDVGNDDDKHVQGPREIDEKNGAGGLDGDEHYVESQGGISNVDTQEEEDKTTDEEDVITPPLKLLPVDIGTFSAYFRQFAPDLFRMEKDHKLSYDPMNHEVVGEQLRATLLALDLWEGIHRVPTEDGGSRYAPEEEVQAALQDAIGKGIDVGVTMAQYIQARDFVRRMERNVFHWLPETQSVLALKHSFTNQKGLVTTMGNHQFASGYSTLRVLRERGCKLPFEVFYLGENDLTPENRKRLTDLGNTCVVDINPMVRTRLGGWEAKPYVLLFSSFREVVIIDSDSLFLQPAERVFEQPGYVENGALFFHDRSIGGGKERKVIDWINQLLPGHRTEANLHVMRSRYMNGKTSHEQESGVVAIDKGRRFGALLAVCQLNAEKERDVSYKFVYGDKETFWLGFEMVGDSHWAFSPFVPGSLGPIWPLAKEDQGKEWVANVCSSKIVHLDANAKPLWFNGGLLKSKFVGDDRKELDSLEYWAIEPGHWLLKDDNIGCLLTTTQPKKVEGEMAQWISHHQKVFAEVATHLPKVHKGGKE